MDSLAFPLKGPSGHANTVMYSCASLMQANAVREAENLHIVDMLVKEEEVSTPASEDNQNTLRCPISEPLPLIQGTENHSTTAYRVHIHTFRDDFLLSVGKSVLVPCEDINCLLLWSKRSVLSFSLYRFLRKRKFFEVIPNM